MVRSEKEIKKLLISFGFRFTDLSLVETNSDAEHYYEKEGMSIEVKDYSSSMGFKFYLHAQELQNIQYTKTDRSLPTDSLGNRDKSFKDVLEFIKRNAQEETLNVVLAYEREKNIDSLLS